MGRDHHHHGPGHHGARPMNRRTFLRRSSEISFAAAVTIAGGSLFNAGEAWALEVKGLKPETMKTLIQMARDIYPHDKIADRFYAIAVKSHDEKAAADSAHKDLVEKGIADLDAAAGEGGYLGVGWEADRVKLLRAVEETPFFQAVRSDLVVSLYNQQDVWPIFGYEGESYSKGGYIDRGFDDIDWL